MKSNNVYIAGLCLILLFAGISFSVSASDYLGNPQDKQNLKQQTAKQAVLDSLAAGKTLIMRNPVESEIMYHDPTETTSPVLTFTNGLLSDPKKEPLLIIDHKRTPYSHLSVIDLSQIETLTFIDGKQGKKQYGRKGRNGVMIITMKK